MQFLDDPRGGERRWRLLSGNNRPLAVGRGGSRPPRDELAAIRRLVDEAEPKVRRDAAGRWRWELSAPGGPDVRCPAQFARQIDARRAFHRFCQAVEQATVTSAASDRQSGRPSERQSERLSERPSGRSSDRADDREFRR